MITPSYLAPGTEVVFVVDKDQEKQAFIEGATHGGGFFLSFDKEGTQRTSGTYSDEPTPGTFHFQRDNAQPEAKSFKPGSKKTDS